MIKANELRIGNFYDHKGRIEQATVNTIAEVWDAERTWCKPIPITEEWLLRFGFEKVDVDFSIEIGRQGFSVSKAQDDDLVLLFREDVGLNYNALKFIDHIHELQNIIFALTDQELQLQDK